MSRGTRSVSMRIWERTFHHRYIRRMDSPSRESASPGHSPEDNVPILPAPCQQEPEGASPPGVGDKSRMTGSIKKVRKSNSCASVIYGLHSGFLTCERRKQESWQDGCKGQWTYQGRIALHQFALEKPRLCKRRRLRACRWSTPASIARQCKHAYSKIAKIIGAHW